MEKNIIKSSKYWLIVPSSGLGKRFGGDIAKQYLMLDNNLSVLDNSLQTFLSIDKVSGIVLALNAKDTNFKNSIYYQHPKILATVTGGKQRYHSVYNALIALKKFANDNDWVLVHDAARPCISANSIKKLITNTKDTQIGSILVSPITSTLKLAPNGSISSTIDRENIYQAQTPQMFKLTYLEKALKNVIDNKLTITDDAQAMELLGYSIKIVIGDENNIKITHKNDISMANKILK